MALNTHIERIFAPIGTFNNFGLERNTCLFVTSYIAGQYCWSKMLPLRCENMSCLAWILWESHRVGNVLMANDWYLSACFIAWIHVMMNLVWFIHKIIHAVCKFHTSNVVEANGFMYVLYYGFEELRCGSPLTGSLYQEFGKRSDFRGSLLCLW